jgi:hypothetical protein
LITLCRAISIIRMVIIATTTESCQSHKVLSAQGAVITRRTRRKFCSHLRAGRIPKIGIVLGARGRGEMATSSLGGLLR